MSLDNTSQYVIDVEAAQDAAPDEIQPASVNFRDYLATSAAPGTCIKLAIGKGAWQQVDPSAIQLQADLSTGLNTFKGTIAITLGAEQKATVVVHATGGKPVSKVGKYYVSGKELRIDGIHIALLGVTVANLALSRTDATKTRAAIQAVFWFAAQLEQTPC